VYLIHVKKYERVNRILPSDVVAFRTRLFNALDIQQWRYSACEYERRDITLVARAEGGIRFATNHNEMLLALQNAFASTRSISVHEVRWERMTLHDQIEVVATRTNVLIGPHGANLLWAIFLRANSTMIELNVPGSGNSNGLNVNTLSNYGSLAHWANVSEYEMHSIGDPRAGCAASRNPACSSLTYNIALVIEQTRAALQRIDDACRLL